MSGVVDGWAGSLSLYGVKEALFAPFVWPALSIGVESIPRIVTIREKATEKGTYVCNTSHFPYYYYYYYYY